MLNYKFSLCKRSKGRQNVLPADFGAMNFLYPSENRYAAGFRSTGVLDKMINIVKKPFNKKSDEKAYFIKDFF